MTYENRKRRVLITFALIWELVRIGILWQINRQFFTGIHGGINAFYLLWLIAPVLALIAGYLMVILEPEAYRIRVLLLMGRAFQAILGSISLVTLLMGIAPVPELIDSLFLLLIVVIGDIVFTVAQSVDVMQRDADRTEEEGNHA